jgi:hypothetical protein
MKFMVTFTGKPAHFKDATSRFLKTGAATRSITGFASIQRQQTRGGGGPVPPANLKKG